MWYQLHSKWYHLIFDPAHTNSLPPARSPLMVLYTQNNQPVTRNVGNDAIDRLNNPHDP